MTATLTASGLTVFRGDRCLFRDLDFALHAGELLLLEGRNGSGKSTLLRAILGLIDVDSGDVLWNGALVRDHRQTFHACVVWLAHRVGFKADLTLVENLRFEAALTSRAPRDLQAVLERLDIDRLRRLPLRALSAGQQRRVALARMLLADAMLWMLDEPFTNLDREGRDLVLELVSEHLQAGGMCIMTAHQDLNLDVPMHRIQLQ